MAVQAVLKLKGAEFYPVSAKYAQDRRLQRATFCMDAPWLKRLQRPSQPRIDRLRFQRQHPEYTFMHLP